MRWKKDFHAVLGVSPRAEDCVIRAGDKVLCQHHHPDKASEEQSGAANDRTAELNEAYEVLSDQKKRAAYDTRRPMKEPSKGPTSPPASAMNRVSTLVSRALIVTASLFVAELVALEEKPWWRWAWDTVTSCGG